MGNLQNNSTEDFPVESRSGGVGYILIYEDPIVETNSVIVDKDADTIEGMMEERERTVAWRHYKSTKTEKTSLVDDLRAANFDNVVLLGYWSGRHRTDIHVLELPRIFERLESADL